MIALSALKNVPIMAQHLLEIILNGIFVHKAAENACKSISAEKIFGHDLVAPCLGIYVYARVEHSSPAVPIDVDNFQKGFDAKHLTFMGPEIIVISSEIF